MVLYRIDEIDQAAIDEAAIALFRTPSHATRNAAVYSPVSAILRHAGVDLKLRRPKGAKGRVVTDWLIGPKMLLASSRRLISLTPNSACCCDSSFIRVCGLAKHWRCAGRTLTCRTRTAWVRRKKGSIASDVRLRRNFAIKCRPRAPGEAHGRVFRFHQGGELKHMLARAKLAYLGPALPYAAPDRLAPARNRLAWVDFHTFRHTWATWMRSGGLVRACGDRQLAGPRSASRYAHVVPREEWQRVDDLPSVEKTWKAS